MKISEIKKFQTVKDRTHESVYRAYQILEKVKYILKIQTPAEVILEIVEECEKD